MPVDPELLFDGPADAWKTVALAHGAGAGMDSPFMELFAKGLGGHGFKPRKSSGRTERQNWEAALNEVTAFLKALKS